LGAIAPTSDLSDLWSPPTRGNPWNRVRTCHYESISGCLVDQRSQRWLVYAGTLWMAGLLSLVGVLVERIGIDYAVHLVIWLPFLAGLFGLRLKGKKASSELISRTGRPLRRIG
jgi:hypothetical protein